MRGTARLSLLMVAAALVAGCNRADTDYFPLSGGKTWDYEIRRIIKGEKHLQRLLLTSFPPVVIDGIEYFPQARLDDRVGVFTRTGDGIVRVNHGNGPGLPVLPAELKPNVTWHAPGRILFLEVTGAFHFTFQERKKQTIDLDYEIEAMDDTVVVAAGRFANCMRVKSSGSISGGAALQEFLGISFVRIEQTEWYAPSVGLVKRVRKESTTPADWNNDYEQELVALEG